MIRAFGSVAALCLLGALLYANSLDVPFYFDDLGNIVDNARIRVIELSPTRLWGAAFENHSPRPVAHLSFALNYYAGGYDVTGYHVVNVAIHILAGVLVWLLARVTFARAGVAKFEGAALFAGALFVAHPVQTQAVTYVVQRMTSLAALLYLLALLLWIGGRVRAGSARVVLWTLAAIAWVLSLGSKQIGITLPLAVLLYEWLFFRDLAWGWLWRSARLLAIPAGVTLLAALALLGTSPLDAMFGGYAVRDFGPWERLLTQPRVVLMYVGLVLLPLPSRLNLLHAVETSHGWLDPPSTLVAWTVLALAGVFAFWVARRDRLIAFGLLWFGLQLALESSVLPLEMAFEHRLYLPMVGVALLASRLLFFRVPLASHWRRWSALGLIALLGAATIARNQVWRDPLEFWSRVVAESPERIRPRNDLAATLSSRGRYEEALAHYREVLRRQPESGRLHGNLGVTLQAQGRYEEALASYRRAVELEPDYARGWNNLGDGLNATGQPDAAIEALERAISLDPEYAEAFYNLGNALVAAGRADEAVERYRTAIRLRPDLAQAHANLGVALAQTNDLEGAARSYRRALQLDPGLASAHNNLGLALVRLGDHEAAVREFEAALRLDPNYEKARVNLRAAVRP